VSIKGSKILIDRPLWKPCRPFAIRKSNDRRADVQKLESAFSQLSVGNGSRKLFTFRHFANDL